MQTRMLALRWALSCTVLSFFIFYIFPLKTGMICLRWWGGCLGAFERFGLLQRHRAIWSFFTTIIGALVHVVLDLSARPYLGYDL